MQKMLADVTTWPSEPAQLLGSRCDDCGATTFPVEERCPRCGHRSMAELALPRRGTLVSWTTQAFPPIVPYAGDDTGASFEPFGVGLVQLDDVIRVDVRLTESDPARLDFDMEVELQIVPFYTEPDGTEILTFAFAPVAAPVAGGPTRGAGQ